MRRTFCRPTRRISPAHQSAQRLTSAACSGSALMLGIASCAFSSSRYLSRLTLMKSMTLFVRDDARRVVAQPEIEALAAPIVGAHADVARPRHAPADVGDAQAPFPLL